MMRKRMDPPPGRIVGNDMAEMVLIPAGEFEMGDPYNADKSTSYSWSDPNADDGY